MRKINLSGGDWQLKGFIGEDWLPRKSHMLETRDVIGWHKAIVPGSVQWDLWQAGVILNPYFEMNSLAAEWTSDRTWLYRKKFTVDPNLREKQIQLVFEGVDYSARFYLNGELLGQNTGMFLPTTFDVTERLDFNDENLLAVVIDPAPFEQAQIGYTSKVYTQKARMNYWWDFCPRLVHLGIWEDVYLIVTGLARIADVHIIPKLSKNLQHADVDIAIQLEKAEQVAVRVALALRREGQKANIENIELTIPAGGLTGLGSFHIDQPELWWPNGAGDQPLYVVEARVFIGENLSDEQIVTFGIRNVKFVQNEDASLGTLPYNLVVNGRKLYIRGWNWVPMDVLYGVEQPEKRERLLRLAQNANVNLLRVWGGGLIEKEAFYRFCDRLGILVWQEFIQSSSGIDNVPSEDADFIRFVVQNAEVAVIHRRNHPSLAVWCGGNELHKSPEHLCDEKHPALAALREVVQRLDPDRHWVPASPAGGVFPFAIPENEAAAQRLQDVHGPWEYQGLRQQYTLYNQATSLLHSEFGVEGLTNLRALNVTITPAHRLPVSLTNPVWHHLGAWWVKERVWREVFGGPFVDIETAVRATQFIQADGLRYAVEADRRRAFHNGGSMPWQFNEPFPMAACTSAVDYYAEPKPHYYTVARAYRPLALSARYNTLALGGEQNFQAEIWAANSGSRQEGALVVRALTLDGSELSRQEQTVELPENRSLALASFSFPTQNISGALFFLDLAFNGKVKEPLARNRYLFSKTENLNPMLADLPISSLDAQVTKKDHRWMVTLENHSTLSALMVWLEEEKVDLRQPGWAYFDDNYFCLLPGEQRVVRVDWSGIAEEARALLVSGWNFSTFRVA